MRTVLADKTLEAIIYRMLQATQLLEGFAVLCWIRHPDVPSALVVATLQKEGKTADEALKSFKQKKAQVMTNKNQIANLQAELRNLKSKNLNFNTSEAE